MNLFQTHWEVLPKNQLALWPLLMPVSKLGYVLYGGTAIALRLGHRQSIDFDFFSNLALDRREIREMLPFLFSAEKTDDCSMSIASLDDLMAHKLKDILQRSEAKDYMDLAAMCQAGVSLEKGLAVATQMFQPDLAPAIALKALTYFEGGDLAELSSGDRQILVNAAMQVSEFPLVSPLSPRLAV